MVDLDPQTRPSFHPPLTCIMVTFFMEGTSPALHVNGNMLVLTQKQVASLRVQLDWLITTMAEDARALHFVGQYEHAYNLGDTPNG